MPERTWYRSLYWRIAIGFILFLTVMLVVQGALFLWLLARSAGSLPASSADRLADLVAADIGVVLAEDPGLDVGQYLREQYEQVYQPVVIVMTDGRAYHNRPFPPPEVLVRFARARLEDRILRDRAARRGRRPLTSAPIVLNGRRAGVVVAADTRPPSLVLRQLGPIMLAVAIALVTMGTALAALFIFRPAQRRIGELEAATRSLGAGDLTTRAPEAGGDEVAALAHSFNQMAGDLQTRAEQLQAADRLRRQLLADVSHELTTPLTAIRGYVETLRMADLKLDPPTRERYLDVVAEEASRLERIIGDLLDLARLEGGGGSLNVQAVSIARLFERVVARHERQAEEKQVVFTTAIAPGVGVVMGDPDRLEQALQNLAANALRHSPQGSRVELSATVRNGFVSLSVRDSGEGIPAEHLPLIFDRFYKVDAARPGGGQGSGLGLSIVKAIVERHGGTVSASSRPGETVLEITLPLPA